MYFEDYVSMLKDMKVLHSKRFGTVNNIYCWDNKSLQNAQMVPIHKIWNVILYF
jgi:hypothetical protein